MDPAISVQDVLRQILAVYAIDGIADVLAGGDDEGERYQQDHGEAVMQAKNGAVGMNVRDFYKALEAAKYVEHLGTERYQEEIRLRRATAISQYNVSRTASPSTSRSPIPSTVSGLEIAQPG